jgi:DNA-binding CsgD family transcriptional regulator
MMNILDRQDGLLLAEGKIIINSQNEHNLFMKLVSHYTKTTWKEEEFIKNKSAMMRVTRSQKPGYYLVSVSLVPFGTGMSVAQMYGICVVNVVDPSEEVLISAVTLQKVFDLTPAESKISIALASGSSPQEIAVNNKVSIGTVRNQIKSIYSKIGVKRQSELVRVVLNLSRMSVQG